MMRNAAASSTNLSIMRAAVASGCSPGRKCRSPLHHNGILPPSPPSQEMSKKITGKHKLLYIYVFSIDSETSSPRMGRRRRFIPNNILWNQILQCFADLQYFSIPRSEGKCRGNWGYLVAKLLAFAFRHFRSFATELMPAPRIRMTNDGKSELIEFSGVGKHSHK